MLKSKFEVRNLQNQFGEIVIAAKEAHSETNLDIQIVQVNFRRLYAFITKILFQPLSAIDCNLSSISSAVKVLKRPV